MCSMRFGSGCPHRMNANTLLNKTSSQFTIFTRNNAKIFTGPHSSYVQVADEHGPIHFSNSLVLAMAGQYASSTIFLWSMCVYVWMHLCVTCWTPSPHCVEHLERVISQLRDEIEKRWILNQNVSLHSIANTYATSHSVLHVWYLSSGFGGRHWLGNTFRPSESWTQVAVWKLSPLHNRLHSLHSLISHLNCGVDGNGERW